MAVLLSRKIILPQRVKLDPVFANNSWEDIIWACQNNKVPDTWAVADYKDMMINSTIYRIDIIGKNHDVYTAGGTAPLTFQLHDCYADTKNMNNSGTNVGGWKSCIMRTMYLPTILSSMPMEAKNAIREVNKLTSAGNQSSSIDTTADKLFLLSEIEIFGSVTYSKSGEGSQYAYYKAGNTKLKRRADSLAYWWERSPLGSNGVGFCNVSREGTAQATKANTARNISFAFCF